MKELGYERLAAQGGDWGADVTTLLGLRHPERVIGIHLNSIPPYKPYLEAGTVLSEVEQAFLNEASRWYEKSGAYDHIQKTTPQTLAYGLMILRRDWQPGYSKSSVTGRTVTATSHADSPRMSC